MTTEPTLGEVLRRLDEVAKQLGALTVQLRDDRVDAAATFVRKDVYFADERRITKLEDEAEAKDKDAAAFRRQMLFLILGAAIPAIAGLLLAVNNLLAAGAAP